MLRPRKAVGLGLILLFGSQVTWATNLYKPGEVIVKYKEGSQRSRSQMNALYDAVGVDHVKHASGLIRGFEHLILDDGVEVEKAIEDLERDSDVAYAQPNYILHTFPLHEIIQENGEETVLGSIGINGVPCIFPGVNFPPGCEDVERVPDPSSGKRPPLKDAPLDVGPDSPDPSLSKTYGLAQIQAPEAWKIFRGSKDFIIADIDTGIDYNHEDLAFNVWRNPNPKDKDIVGYDFIHNDGLPFDDNSHGTHTGGTIAAVGGNGVGISGVIPRVSLMSVKFLTGEGGGTTADAIRAIDYAVSNGAKVLSNSWGGSADKDNLALRDVIDRARTKDVLFIAAAGNDGNDNDSSDPSYPAAFDLDNIISVAATDSSDRLASFSNYGRKTTHLAAPGVKIYSTIPGDKYKSSSGTSMACPHVAGAAALVWSKYPRFTYKQVKDILLKSVDVLPSLEGKMTTGGRLNILKALQLASSQ